MYRLAKYLYELGHRNAYEKLKSELYLYIGHEPVQYKDIEHGIFEDDKAFKKRVDSWFGAKELLDKFFNDDPDNY